jgi:hypothetical protein
MPVVRQRRDMPAGRGPGWTEVTCASPALFGAAVPLSAREYLIGPGASGPRIELTGAEAMAYVAAGSGVAEAGGEQFRLAPESVLWLSRAGQLVLTAGPEGLTVLVAESAGA